VNHLEDNAHFSVSVCFCHQVNFVVFENIEIEKPAII